MANKRNTFPNYPKHILQLGILGILTYFIFQTYNNPSYFIDFEAHCPLGGVQAAIGFFLYDRLACNMTSGQIFVGFLLLVTVVFFSKLFCAFVCPLGTIAEWLGKLGDKFKVRYTIEGILDKVLRLLKYLLLFITFYYTIESSELFCKKFDPYYAITDGFGYDVNTIWAIVSISVLILGSVFFRMFWCRYLCPLGALSNIFKYFFITAFVLIIYTIFQQFDIYIPYTGPLAVICIASYLIETWGQKSIITPFFKVTRNSKSCIGCNKCSQVCAQGINVAEMKVIDHIDCNMCGDCTMVCPVPDTLNVNKKNWLKWVPGVITVLFIVISLGFGDRFEVATLDERWGTKEQIENSTILTHAGLKNIKCYGSSKVFANKLREINGVLGVTAYVSTNTVKIFYDPLIIDEQKIMKSIFTPEKRLIRRPGKDVTRVVQVDVLLENFFDIYDTRHLVVLLNLNPDVLGFTSMYSCPIKVSLFLRAHQDTIIDVDELKQIIETDEIQIERQQLKKTIPLNFNVVDIDVHKDFISRDQFMEMMFEKYRSLFKSYYRNDRNRICSFEFPFKDVEKPEMVKWLPYLSSHLSFNSGVLGFETEYKNGQYWGLVHYEDDIISVKEILMLIQQDSLRVQYKTGTEKWFANPFALDNYNEKKIKYKLND